MSISPNTAGAQAGHNNNSVDRSIGAMPDFHHVPPSSAVALESYMHLYLESTALAESLLKDSIGRRAN